MPVRLAVIGHIKIGEKGETRQGASGTEYQMPVKLDHIKITTTERGPDNNFLPHPVMQKLVREGGKLKSLKCSLLFNDDRNFRAQFARYDGKKLICHGDGITAMENGVERACSCGREVFGYQGQGKCSPTATLDVVLSEQSMSGGVFRFSTRSWNTISSIQGSLAYLHELTQGFIAGVPLVLTLQSKTVQIPGAGGNKINYLALQIDGTPMEIMDRAIQRAQLMQRHQLVFRHLALAASPMVAEIDDGEGNGLIEEEDLEEFQLSTEPPPPPPPDRPKRTFAEIYEESEGSTPPPAIPTPSAKPPSEPKREFNRGDNVWIMRIDSSIVEGKIFGVTAERFVIDSDEEEPVFVDRLDIEEIRWV